MSHTKSDIQIVDSQVKDAVDRALIVELNSVLIRYEDTFFGFCCISKVSTSSAAFRSSSGHAFPRVMKNTRTLYFTPKPERKLRN